MESKEQMTVEEIKELAKELGFEFEDDEEAEIYRDLALELMDEAALTIDEDEELAVV